jgi:hypothetical protein
MGSENMNAGSMEAAWKHKHERAAYDMKHVMMRYERPPLEQMKRKQAW